MRRVEKEQRVSLHEKWKGEVKIEGEIREKIEEIEHQNRDMGGDRVFIDNKRTKGTRNKERFINI